MSYNYEGLVVTAKLKDGHSAAKAGEVISLQTDGTWNTKQDIGAFGVLKTEVTEECTHADIQLSEVAAVKVKAGDTFDANDLVAAGTGADAGFAVAATGPTDVNLLGYAISPSDANEFVAVKLK